MQFVIKSLQFAKSTAILMLTTTAIGALVGFVLRISYSSEQSLAQAIRTILGVVLASLLYRSLVKKFGHDDSETIRREKAAKQYEHCLEQLEQATDEVAKAVQVMQSLNLLGKRPTRTAGRAQTM